MSQDNPFGDRKGLEVNVTIEPPSHLRATAAKVSVANVPFGDPMLSFRIDRQKRYIFFDIGAFSQVSARVAHQITDIFITHAHVDHLCGFPWLLGRRINSKEPCRMYGPPGLAQHVSAMMTAFIWDRVGDGAPRFDVAEIYGDHLRWTSFQVGHSEGTPGENTPIQNGILLKDPLFLVRTTTLDHGIPVQAYSFEESTRYSADPEKIKAHQLTPGAWISELQRRVLAEDWEHVLALPDGSEHDVRSLSEKVLASSPGQKIVYTTDFGDTPENRSKVVSFAQKADIFICETSYLDEDSDHAERTGHMTAKACGEMAQAAQVHSVLPFHFSNRYVEHPERLYQEVHSIFANTLLPPTLSLEK